MHIEITEDIDKLARKRWRFWFDDRGGLLVLDAYAVEVRATSRHAYKPCDHYARITVERYGSCNRLAEKDVPLPEHIKRRARDAFMDKLVVCTDSQRR